MILKAKQEFDKVMLDRLDSDDFLDFISNSSMRALANKLLNNLQDHGSVQKLQNGLSLVPEVQRRTWRQGVLPIWSGNNRKKSSLL